MLRPILFVYLGILFLSKNHMNLQILQSLFFGLLITGVLGALIGIDKDIGKHKKSLLTKKDLDYNFWSIRTFSLIAIFGALMTQVDIILGGWYVFILTGLLLCFLLVLVHYIHSVFKQTQISPATELVAILSYFIGVLVFTGYMQIAIIFAILLTFFVSSKDFLEGLWKYVSKDELRTTLKFAAIAFVILPLLPDQRFSLIEIFSFVSGKEFTWAHALVSFEFFNPYSIWFFVVVMSWVSYLGYILTKFFGKNSSIMLSSLLGGMVSSTATTASMTQKSKEDSKNIDSYVIGTLLASCIMFLRVFVIVLFFSTSLFGALIIPGWVMFATFLLATTYFYFKAKKNTKIKNESEDKNIRSPFRIAPALKFAWVIVLIKFISWVGIIYKDVWGEGLFYSALGIISWFADVDAITQTMAVDSGRGLITFSIAASTILLAVMSNNFVKGSIAWRLGHKEFGYKVMWSFLVSIFAGLVAIGILTFVN